MRYWYAYTGENIVLGHGRAIRLVISIPQTLEPLLRQAHQQAERLLEMPTHFTPHVSVETFTAALMAPLAIQELGTDSTTAISFSSTAQLFSLFDGLAINQVAINLYNGRIASAYALGSMEAIAQRVIQGFEEGELLLLPRDTIRLYAPETLNSFPGIVTFLLMREQAEQKAFAEYLRRGTPPTISNAQSAAIASLRPVLRTWEREARLEREMMGKDAHG